MACVLIVLFMGSFHFSVNTIYMHDSDRNKKCLSFGHLGILSLICRHLERGYSLHLEMFTKKMLYFIQYYLKVGQFWFTFQVMLCCYVKNLRLRRLTSKEYVCPLGMIFNDLYSFAFST